MRKCIKSAIAVCLVFAFLFLTSSCGQEVRVARHREQLSDADFLSVYGTLLKNADGEYVTLRGTNLGGWLCFEDWMCPLTGVTDAWSAVNTLESRFGTKRAAVLLDTYCDNWITEEDISNIRELGFNCVRVPFWYRNFYSDDNGTEILDENGQLDLSRLQWVVDTCRKHGLYVILDMHGAPGFQSVSKHSGKANSCALYADTEEGEKYRALTAKLWGEIASRFAGNPAVAGYDLLNEPLCDNQNKDELQPQLWELYDTLYDAVRAVDSEHIVFFEGIWRMSNLPKVDRYEWENAVYELHLYDSYLTAFSWAAGESIRQAYYVPTLIGEFKPMDGVPLGDVLNVFNKKDCSWTTWSYKGVADDPKTCDWFIVTRDKTDAVNVLTDSYETIMKKWGASLRTNNSFSISSVAQTESEYALKDSTPSRKNRVLSDLLS